MILIALGSNIAGPWGPPRATLARAVAALDAAGIAVLRRSRFLLTAPYGRKDQPPFVNAVALVASHLPPDALLARLHGIERAAGRRRRIRWGPRSLDLDLLAWHDVVRAPRGGSQNIALRLPHPELHKRPFVLVPLSEVAPRWHHPVSGATAAQLLRRVGRGAEGMVLEPV
jgi:2-amino-4-hydroxy-6-hydroxymethyldihydropteridine diphosphokinase